MSILWLAEPLPQPLNTLQRLNNMNALRQKLDHHATEVCALVLTSDSAPVWVNAFGPIAFCKFPPGLGYSVLSLTIYNRWPLASGYSKTQRDYRGGKTMGKDKWVAGVHHNRSALLACKC